MADVTAREAAFLALLAAFREGKFISDTLEAWREKENPSEMDDRLAQEIANGSCRMALLLDAYAGQLNPKGRLSLKPKEKALLRTALYQFAFLDRVPSFAIADESVKIGKKYCHPSFVSFLNVLLRRAAMQPLDPPLEPFLRYSYPKFYVDKVFGQRGKVEGEALLAYGNHPAPLTIRLRPGWEGKELEERELKVFSQSPPFAWVTQRNQIASLGNWKGGYIQNWTPAHLMQILFNEQNPKNLLDLCAAPGGKLLMAHDLFPHAHLFGNDVTEDKIFKIRKNISKYRLEVELTCQPGERFHGREKFDLIIIDAPCSNTGVLNKRPEARWRLSEESIGAHVDLQKKLITHALTFLNPGGEIWYMTCSILDEENSGLIKSLGLKVRKEELILPNGVEKDGGYAAAIQGV